MQTGKTCECQHNHAIADVTESSCGCSCHREPAVIITPFPHIIIEPALSEDDWYGLWDSCWSALPGSVGPRKENNIPEFEFGWKPAMAKRLCGLFGVQGTPTIGWFMERHAGYSLDPHIDPPNFLVTVIHYMPEHDGMDGLGTVLYTAQHPLTHSGKGAEYWKDGCTAAVKVPFRTNLMLAFLNTPLSAHGLEPIPETRLAYQWHIVER